MNALLGRKLSEERHQVDFGHLCVPPEYSLDLAHTKKISKYLWL